MRLDVARGRRGHLRRRHVPHVTGGERDDRDHREGEHAAPRSLPSSRSCLPNALAITLDGKASGKPPPGARRAGVHLGRRLLTGC